MATLVLTAIGTAVGGPIGGAIGAALGQQVDRAVFGTGPARQGPRLKELNVQTSSYGSFVPAIFGAMRVAGSVIWASDLIESSAKTSNNKGRPATHNYSYSVNLAVALSSRPLQSIGRIWADGNLVRGAAGDFKIQTEFRFYSGQDDQALDPLLASAEMAGHMPAHRGLAYVVFEGLQLADFGNRIPLLTFEVFERSAPVAVEDIASVLSHGLISGDSGETIMGYAASGDDARTALAPLLAAMPVDLETRADGLKLTGYTRGPRRTLIARIAMASGTKSLPSGAYQMRTADNAPSRCALRYYEPVRDYQIGIQTSERLGFGQRGHQIEFPATIDSQTARRLSEVKLAQLHRQRFLWSGYVVDQPAAFETGDWIVLPGDGVALRIIEVEQQSGYAKITAVQAIDRLPALAVTTDPGRHLADDDLLSGVTHLVAMDLPGITTTIADTPIIALAAAGSGPGWRGAAVSQVIGNQILEIGQTTAAAIMGSAQTKLPWHPFGLRDLDHYLDIELLHADMPLPLAPSNGLCWLSGEILRYRIATAQSATRYRLSGFDRGLFDTAGFSAAHAIGDRFVLLDSERLKIVDYEGRLIGQNATFNALGVGDIEPATASLLSIGRAIQPLAPVHGRMALVPSGDLNLSWFRRARVDFGWVDGVDQPLIEDRESYTITLVNAGQSLNNWTVDAPQLAIAASSWASLLPATQADFHFEIRQIGRHALSNPLIIAITTL